MAESSNQPDKKRDWTAEDYAKIAEAFRPLLQDVIVAAETLSKTYTDHKKQEEEAKAKRLSLVSKHNRNLTAYILTFLVGIVVVMSYLTWLGRVSGDALLFLVGTVTGYALLMVQNLTYPLFEEEVLTSDGS